jgi:hypothetical protein
MTGLLRYGADGSSLKSIQPLGHSAIVAEIKTELEHAANAAITTGL